MTLRRDSGIDTGKLQRQFLVLHNKFASSIPSHKTTCPSGLRTPLDHWSSLLYPPNARQQTKPNELGVAPKSSYRFRTISTPERSNAALISFRKAHFLTLVSMSVVCSSRKAILSGNPGKPPPLPTSASRPRSIGSNEAAKRLSPKCRATMSASSLIEVRGTIWFHFF